jgi:cardiolipin synthase
METIFQKFYVFCNRNFEGLIARLTPSWITPNGVSIFRAILALPVLLLLYLDLKGLAIALYVFAAVLDYWDGALARGRRAITDLGKFLDPICDKVFIALLLLPLTFYMFTINEMRIDLAGLLAISIFNIGLETCLAAIRTDNYHHRNDLFADSRTLSATASGKIKFNLQILGAGMAIVSYPGANQVCVWISTALLTAALPFLVRSIQQKTQRM